MLKIARRIRRLQKDRNRITHGLWNWEYGSPDTVTASTFNPRFDFTQPFDFRKLFAVPTSVSERRFYDV
jgi:hypothetical protein